MGWWVGRWQKSQLGHPWISHDDHTMVYATLVGHRGSESNSRSPPPNWHPPLVSLYSHEFKGLAKWPPGKQTGQYLTLDTLG